MSSPSREPAAPGPARRLPHPRSAVAPVCLLAVAALITSEAAGQVGTGVRDAETRAVEREYRDHVRALCDDRMAGRAAGTEGGELAVRYLVEHMRRAGLQALPGLQRRFRQEFAVEDPRPVLPESEHTGLEVLGAGDPRPQPLGGQALPFRFSPDGEVEGEVVFAGYGLSIPELSRDDYDGLDVRGKIVLVLRGAPRWRQPGSPYGALDLWQALGFTAKIANATRARASGFLLVDHGELGGSSARTLIEKAATARGEAEIPAMWITRAAAQRILCGSGASLVDRQAALERGDTRAALERRPGPRVRMRVGLGTRRADLETANVVGLLVGSDPERREEYVVIGAHHDHLGLGHFGSLAKDGVGVVHPGADDNASGLAALLVLAKAMAADAADPPRRSLLFVAFGAEELGLRGSYHFLHESPIPKKSIVAMINLDMIGRAGRDRLRIEGVGSGEGLAALVEAAGRQADWALRARETAVARSDHWQFLRAGIPALFVHSGIHDQYHRPTDVPCLVRVPEAVRVVEIVRSLVLAIADRDEAPAFVPRIVRQSFLGGRKK